MGDFAREAALSALERCRRDGAWSSMTVDKAISKYGLDSRSAALASNICFGTLENITLCDYYIDYFSSGKKIEPKVRDILRTAVYQLIFLDKIPASAAVNESVMLCKKLGYSRASGFVNAVLRKISSASGALPEIPGCGEPEYLSVRYSHPLWLAEKLCSEYGYEFTEAFFKADNTPAETCIQINTLKTNKEEFTELIKKSNLLFSEHEFLENCIVVHGDVRAIPGFDEGLFYVQDPAARMSVDVSGAEPYMHVLDACAAPGGKSFAAAILMNNRGYIESCDIHEKKTALIENGAARLGISIISAHAADARVPRSDKYDLVIADVPCSGLGVIRKKPEIRFKNPKELSNLPEIQKNILYNLAECVKPGGVLIYSTCTVLKEENENIIKQFLNNNADFEAEEFSLPHVGKTESGMHTFWPHIDGTDGFFVCKLRRK